MRSKSTRSRLTAHDLAMIYPDCYVEVKKLARVLRVDPETIQTVLRSAMENDIEGELLDRNKVWRIIVMGAEEASRGNSLLAGQIQALENAYAEAQARKRTYRPGSQPSPALRASIIARDGNYCRYCGKRVNVHSRTLDHVVSVKQGGLTTEENLVVCCRPCNNKKWAGSLEECGMTLLPSRPRRAASSADEVA